MALNCQCGHGEYEHHWEGGGLTRVAQCWHRDRDFDKVPDERDPRIPFIYCACEKYVPRHSTER